MWRYDGGSGFFASFHFTDNFSKFRISFTFRVCVCVAVVRFKAAAFSFPSNRIAFDNENDTDAGNLFVISILHDIQMAFIFRFTWISLNVDKSGIWCMVFGIPLPNHLPLIPGKIHRVHLGQIEVYTFQKLVWHKMFVVSFNVPFWNLFPLLINFTRNSYGFYCQQLRHTSNEVSDYEHEYGFQNELPSNDTLLGIRLRIEWLCQIHIPFPAIQ